MEKKYIAILILSAIVILTLILNLVIPQKTLSPASALEECKSLRYNGEGKINIVFFSDKQQAEKYSGSFLEIEPFKSYPEAFNFYYIDSYKPQCELYHGIATLCYSNDLIKKAGSCPNDYIVVLDSQPAKIRSSSYMNVLSLNTAHQLSVFPHEFGHAFAILAEEYVPAQIPGKSKNCMADCDKFQECFKGCSKSDYYRSIDSGIMRTLTSKTYGSYDEKIIAEKISARTAKITGNAIQNVQDCQDKSYYLIRGNYSNNQISALSETVEIGCPGSNGAGDFNYSLILRDNSVIETNEFNPELIFTDAQESEVLAGETYGREGLFILKIPVIENAQKIIITKQNVEVAELSLYPPDSIPCKIE